MTKKALYPYTLTPIALKLSNDEFKKAQLSLFQNTNTNTSLASITTKEWLILGVIGVIALIGIIFVNGYSTLLFWFLAVGVVIYLLLRTLGLKWYMQKEYEKQVSNTAMPQEFKNMKLGVQSHGLIITLPALSQPAMPHGMQMRGAPMQQAVIAWDKVTSWEETDEFLFIMFTVNNQAGSQIIPKRLAPALPINTIKEHLTQITPKGLKIDPLHKQN